MFFLSRGALLALATLTPSALLAHALLVEAFPPKDGVLKEPPREVVLRFDEPVGERYLGLAVIHLDRKRRVDNRDVHLEAGDHSVVRATLKHPLPPGNYLVRYRVQSADGHVITGRYPFKIEGTAVAAQAPEEPESPSWLERLYRFFLSLFGR